MKQTLDVIAFDADDTLWHNETLYHAMGAEFKRLMARYRNEDGLEEQLYQTEVRNIHAFGYGIKSFVLSMIETAVTVTAGEVSGADVGRLVAMAKENLTAPVQLLDHVEETVARLAGKFTLMIITKGDLLDQHSKVTRSGLADYFAFVEVVNEKDAGNYRRILDRYRINPERFMMVGNSLKSDVLPVAALGGHAVHIPYEITWAHEAVPDHAAAEASYHELAHIGQLPALVERLTGG